MINISYSDNDQKMTCAFEGRLGADNTPKITETINARIDELDNPDNLKIIFDLKKVDFIASSFIRVCITSFKKVGHENFSIINTKPIIKKTFAIAGLTDEMNIR